MHTVKLTFALTRRADEAAVADAINGLIIALQRDGRVLSDEWPIAMERRSAVTCLSVPDVRSMTGASRSKWVRQARSKLPRAGLGVPKVECLGHEPNAATPCRHKAPTAFVLFTTAYSSESPLGCGDCFGPVPLYRVPYTHECGTYEDVIFWRRRYQACDELWLGTCAGERCAYRMLAQPESPLAIEGRDLCRVIEEHTGRPVFYSLYRYYGRSVASERRRRCPMCGGSWLLAEPWHGKFDFKCDRCRLVSNIADDVAVESRSRQRASSASTGDHEK